MGKKESLGRGEGQERFGGFIQPLSTSSIAVIWLMNMSCSPDIFSMFPGGQEAE